MSEVDHPTSPSIGVDRSLAILITMAMRMFPSCMRGDMT